MVAQLNIPRELNEFETVLFRLKDLHFLTSPEILPGNFQHIIDNFDHAFVELSRKFNISMTNKIHIIVHHLADYYWDTGLSLRKTTEEIVEHMHKAVNKRLMSSYHVKDIAHSKHGLQL